MHKKCKCKNAMQNKYKSKKKTVSSKTQIAENDFGRPLDSHLGGVQDMQSRLPGFHAFRFLNLPHMQSVQEWVSVRFGFLSLHQHLNGHIDFQERVGGWHSPPAQVPNAFRESGGPFPRGWPYRGSICFAFSLHLFCFFVCFFVAFLLFFFAFFLLFTSVFCDFFQKVSSFGGPQFGSGTFPFGWSPVHLAGVSLNIGRSSSASRVHLGSPFSSLMLPLSSAQVLLPCPG